MAFRLLAFDHDETIAMHGAIAAGTADALAAARQAGWLLAMVTGRPHPELLEICPQVGLFDLVVDENGAVLYFPADGALEQLADGPTAPLRQALARRGVPMVLGRAVTIAPRAHDAAVAAVLDEHRLPFDVFRNRFVAMIVPRGTSKATGLREGLRRLGVAPADVIGVGDDENDFALFEVAGLRVAVGNAIDTVKEAADLVLARPNGEGVVQFIHERVLRAPESLPSLRRS